MSGSAGAGVEGGADLPRAAFQAPRTATTSTTATPAPTAPVLDSAVGLSLFATLLPDGGDGACVETQMLQIPQVSLVVWSNGAVFFISLHVLSGVPFWNSIPLQT